MPGTRSDGNSERAGLGIELVDSVLMTCSDGGDRTVIRCGWADLGGLHKCVLPGAGEIVGGSLYSEAQHTIQSCTPGEHYQKLQMTKSDGKTSSTVAQMDDWYECPDDTSLRFNKGGAKAERDFEALYKTWHIEIDKDRQMQRGAGEGSSGLRLEATVKSRADMLTPGALQEVFESV